MTNGAGPAIPLLGEISLESVQRIDSSVDAGFHPTPIVGLPGELQQRANRFSHRMRIVGTLFGEEAAGQLESLQSAASEGEELTFSSDITKALDLQKVVITSFRATEVAGEPDRYAFEVELAESPPLPPPAELSGFGGLDDFGLGDLGFDTDLLGDLEDLAGDIAGAVSDALDVVDALGALANLDGLELGGGVLDPMNDAVAGVEEAAKSFRDAFSNLSGALS